jgi:hypothetical protein
MSVNVAKFVVESLPGVGVGLVAGAFIPAVLRKVKAAIVKLALTQRAPFWWSPLEQVIQPVASRVLVEELEQKELEAFYLGETIKMFNKFLITIGSVFVLSYILHFPKPVVILLLITIAGAHIYYLPKS